ncbi:hypothetical protein FHL15_011269 [Xylaria flabelliformis]|uniref:AMP-dependent synthetase/ligase domain-containing protein n=1 Tax=Xylaria flabelliformis TaxID=2512241 RepID=A0A553HIS9_9PEZI|nr:hypothetical protein FHL15_011269 [Xylaria flabelliformis]
MDSKFSSLQPSLSPSDASYVIFTSATTWTPKGAIVEHKAFFSSATAHSIVFHIGPTSRVLHFAPYVFDAAAVEIVKSLATGGYICILLDEAPNGSLHEAMARLHV